jgi:16S rRNA (cytidine1402-2'-O)-methyltransferase
VHAHNERARTAEIVAEVRRGLHVAYVTDAGMPGISDPGARLVRACIDAGLPVEVIPGPSAALAALVVSGLSTDRFVFEGFLPSRGKDRDGRLTAVAAEERTTILFEAPHRLARTVADLVNACDAERSVVIARELTKLHEEVWRGTLAGAVEHIAGARPRGEIVLVLAGRTVDDTEPTDDELATEARALVEQGMSTREAADHLAAQFKVGRRQAYQVVIAQRRDR